MNFLLRFHASPPFEAALLQRVAAIGVGPYRSFPLDGMAPEVIAAVEEGCVEAQRRIEARSESLGEVVEGWQEIPPMGAYGDDFLFRAAVAWKFIYTNSPEEALYPIAETDDQGDHLTGARDYELRFPPGGLPPVDAFWSLTLYDSVTRLMVHNPIERYSLGDRTPGLVYGPGGSLTIFIQHDPPPPEHTANWLPAPEGEFYLNVRAYMPRTAMRTGDYRLPAVRRVR